MGSPGVGLALSPPPCAPQQSRCRQGWDQTRRGETTVPFSAWGVLPPWFGGLLPGWGGDLAPLHSPRVGLSCANPCSEEPVPVPVPVPSPVQPRTKRRRELASEDEDEDEDGGNSGGFSPSARSWGLRELWVSPVVTLLGRRCPGGLSPLPSPSTGTEPPPAAPCSEEDEEDEDPQPRGRRKRIRCLEEEEEEG